MSARRIQSVTGRAIPMPGDDIDTDRITPARFLKAVTFEGMEKALFCDERENAPDHPIDDPAYRGARMMFVGKNFGSGSSREHAPQALKRHGVHALIGVSFAEIFAGNCFAIGVPTGAASAEDAHRLIRQAQEVPETRFTVDLEASAVRFGESVVPIEIQETRRLAFLSGKWDMLANLRAGLDRVGEVARRLPYVGNFGEEAREEGSPR